MPELPEVEVSANAVRTHFLGSKLLGAGTSNQRLRKTYTLFCRNTEYQHLAGRKLEAVTRRAKYLLFDLQDFVIVVHLGMSGTLRVATGNLSQLKRKHDHAWLSFSKNRYLIFNDPRRFGMFTLCPADKVYQLAFLQKLGLEPLEREFNRKNLAAICANSTQPIKILLMDQSKVVGVGNIYAAEALFRSQVHPLTPANLLTATEIEKIIKSCKVILRRAIAKGGSSISDFLHGQEQSGYFQLSHRIYGRVQQPCFNCKSIIQQMLIGGRTSCFCPNCQQLPAKVT